MLHSSLKEKYVPNKVSECIPQCITLGPFCKNTATDLMGSQKEQILAIVSFPLFKDILFIDILKTGKKEKEKKSLLFYPTYYFDLFLKKYVTLKRRALILFLPQVYHISRNTWFKMETRMIKNVCAPAVVLGERIVIVGGESEPGGRWAGHGRATSCGKRVTSRPTLFHKTLFKSTSLLLGECGPLAKVLFSSRSFSLS